MVEREGRELNAIEEGELFSFSFDGELANVYLKDKQNRVASIEMSKDHAIDVLRKALNILTDEKSI